MDLIFNELSVSPLSGNKTMGFERVVLFLKTFKRSQDLSYNKIRFDVATGEDVLAKTRVTREYSLADYRGFFLQDRQNRRYGQLLLGLAKRPYIDDNSEEEGRYIQNTFKIKKDGQIIEPYGLAAAYIYSTIGIGFNSEPFWEVCKFELTIIGEGKGNAIVFCVSKPEHFEDRELNQFVENRLPVILMETSMLPENKRINLRDDHGKDVLREFSERLVRSPYITGIINSLPYNRFERNFIRKVFPNGNIEIVLTKTDKGLGVIVETTGRNKRETEEIAKILERNFSYDYKFVF